MANRREFIKKAGLAVGATAALSGVATAIPSIPGTTAARSTMSAKDHASLADAGYKLIPRVAGYGDITSPDTKNGLPMDVFRKDDRTYSWVTIPENFSGWKGSETTYAHHGALVIMLSTVSGYLAMVTTKQATTNKSVSVNYHAYAPLGQKLRAEARIAEKNGQQMVVEASVYDSENNLLASSSEVWEVVSESAAAVVCDVTAKSAFNRNMETHFANG